RRFGDGLLPNTRSCPPPLPPSPHRKNTYLISAATRRMSITTTKIPIRPIPHIMLPLIISCIIGRPLEWLACAEDGTLSCDGALSSTPHQRAREREHERGRHHQETQLQERDGADLLPFPA